MSPTKIQWADETWNPTVGCTRVSAGCDNCYAFALHDKRFAANRKAALSLPVTHMPPETLPQTARRLGFKLPWLHQYDLPFSRVQLLPDRLDKPLRVRKPTRWFVDSMADLFHEAVPLAFLAEVFDVMAAGEYRGREVPDHQYLILTKRPERMRALIADELPAYVGDNFPGDRALSAMMEIERWPLPNVWLGTSVEDQQRADERIPHLLATPAAVRFISAEPLLGSIDLGAALGFAMLHEPPGSAEAAAAFHELTRAVIRSHGGPFVHWVIVGGESGPRARPMDLAWARSLVAQCRAAGISVFVKQLGATPMDGGFMVPLQDRKGGDPAEWPEDLRVREWPR